MLSYLRHIKESKSVIPFQLDSRKTFITYNKNFLNLTFLTQSTDFLETHFFSSTIIE